MFCHILDLCTILFQYNTAIWWNPPAPLSCDSCYVYALHMRYDSGMEKRFLFALHGMLL